MIAALVLFAAAVMLAGTGGRALSAVRWPFGSPALALVLWLSLSAGILGSVLLGSAILALPAAPGLFADVAGWLGACLELLEDHYAVPLGVTGVIGSIVLALAVLGRAAACVAQEARGSRDARLAARAMLEDNAGWSTCESLIVVEDPRLAAFCIPGRVPAIVVTTGALAALTMGERTAVLAHERAHLRSRHHWAITWAAGLHRAFPFVPAFRDAAQQIPLLVEMHADDVASRVSGRRTLATALVRMATGAGPAATLSISGPDALTRVHRLVDTPQRIGRVGMAAVAGGAAALVVAPILIMLAPAVESSLDDHCAPYEHPCDAPGTATHRVG